MSTRWSGRPISRTSRAAISGGSSISTISASTPEPAAHKMRLRANLCSLIGGFVAICLAGAGLTEAAFAGPGEGLSAYNQADYGTAYRELAPAAAAGDALAQYTLARMYFSGVGVSRDVAEGFKWLRKAALAGIGPAQYQLGAHYEWGVDVGQDYAEAARWYRMAADRVSPRRNIAWDCSTATVMASRPISSPPICGSTSPLRDWPRARLATR